MGVLLRATIVTALGLVCLPVEAQSARQRLQEALAPRAEASRVVTPLSRETVSANARVERPLALQLGRCYRVAVAASDASATVSIAIVRRRYVDARAEHTSVATIGVEGEPFCPEHSNDYTLRMKSSAAGTLVWQVWAAEAPPAQAVRDEAHPIGGEGSGYLQQAMRRRHSRVGEGSPAVDALRRGSLRRSQRATVTFRARAGRCYKAIAVGMATVRTMSLRASDALGIELGRSTVDAAPHVDFCARTDGEIRVELKMELGYGGWAVQIFEGGVN